MLANRVREFTLTAGAGDITLAGPLPGHIAFADGFAVGDSVTYVIEDGDDYEIGTGTLTATDTLQRTTVGETLVSGIYDKASPSPISLSGNARVYCAATANFLLNPTLEVDTIREQTPDGGVTVDDVLLKDGGGTFVNPVVSQGAAVPFDAHVVQDTMAGTIPVHWQKQATSYILQAGGVGDLAMFDLANLGMSLVGNATVGGDVTVGVDRSVYVRGGLNAFRGVVPETDMNLMLGTGAGSEPRIYLYGSANGQPTAGDVFIGTKDNIGTLRIEGSIDASGNMNINGGNSVHSVDYGNLLIGDFAGGNNGITIQTPNTGRGGIAFSDGNTSGVASRQGRFDFTHALDRFEWLTSDGLRMSLSGTLLDVQVAAQFNSATFRGATSHEGGGQAVTLGPGSADHTYIGFSARTASPTARSGYIGYPSVGTTTMTFANELAGAQTFTTNGSTWLTGLSSGNVYMSNAVGIGEVSATHKLEVKGTSSNILKLWRQAGSGWVEFFEGATRKAYFGYESSGGGGIVGDAEPDAIVLRSTEGPIHLCGDVTSVALGLTVDRDGITLGRDTQINGQLGIGGAPHATYQQIIHSSSGDHIRLDNDGELGFIRVEDTGNLILWAHGDTGDSVDIMTGSGAGTVVASFSGTSFDVQTPATIVGDSTFAGTITVEGNLLAVGPDMRIKPTVANTSLRIGGDVDASDGAMWRLYGSSHISNANDGLFSTGGVNRLFFDHSLSKFDFLGHDVEGFGDIVAGSAVFAQTGVNMIQFDRSALAGIDHQFYIRVDNETGIADDYVSIGTTAADLRVYGNGSAKALGDFAVGGQIVGSQASAAFGAVSSSVGNGPFTFMDVNGGINRVGAYDYSVTEWQDLHLNNSALVLGGTANSKSATFEGKINANAGTLGFAATGATGVSMLVVSASQTSANGLEYGAIGWTPTGGGAGSSPNAAIVAVQQSADNNVLGLKFYVHSSAASADPMDLALTLNADLSADFAGAVGATQFRSNSGSAAMPTYSFSNDPDTGMYRVGTDAIGFSTGGSQGIGLTTTDLNVYRDLNLQGNDMSNVGILTVNNEVRLPDGGPGDPSMTFSTDSNTSGFYRAGPNIIGVSAANIPVLLIDSLGLRSALTGTAANPVYAFDGDRDTGIYRAGANTLGVATGGTQALTVSDAQVTLDRHLTANGGAKISVQNQVDGGSGQGIFLWDTSNTGYGIYMASPGANKSLSGGVACSPLSGGSGVSTRIRVSNVSNQSVVFENSSEQCLMSLTANEGDLFTRGDVSVGGKLNLGAPTELTISSGEVTVAKSYHKLDTEADAATDDLVTINGGSAGDRIVLSSTSSARTITLKDMASGGNLQIAGDFSLGNPADTIELIFDGSNWLEIGRSNNG